MGRTVELTDPYLGEDPATAPFFHEGSAITELLHEDVLFENCRPYVENPWDPKEQWKIGPSTIVLFVNCNDVFWWATADAECLTDDEVKPLYELWKAKGHWGVTEWCCLKRKMRPQTPVEKKMRAEGAWSDALEALPARNPKDCG